MIEISHRFQTDMADLFKTVLSSPMAASDFDYKTLGHEYRHHMARAVLESRSVYCSLLQQDVECFGPLVFNQGQRAMPQALYVD